MYNNFSGAGKMMGDRAGIISTVVIVFIFCLSCLGVLVLRKGPICKLDNEVLSPLFFIINKWHKLLSLFYRAQKKSGAKTRDSGKLI